MTFGEVADRYLDHVGAVRQRKATTVSDYRSMLTAHLAPFFGTGSGSALGPRSHQAQRAGQESTA